MIGRMRERISIETPTITKGPTGAVVQFWEHFEDRWAEVIVKNSLQFDRMRLDHDDITVAYKIRGRLAVTPKMRVVHSGRIYPIVAMECEDNRPPETATSIILVCTGEQ